MSKINYEFAFWYYIISINATLCNGISKVSPDNRWHLHHVIFEISWTNDVNITHILHPMFAVVYTIIIASKYFSKMRYKSLIQHHFAIKFFRAAHTTKHEACLFMQYSLGWKVNKRMKPECWHFNLWISYLNTAVTSMCHLYNVTMQWQHSVKFNPSAGQKSAAVVHIHLHFSHFLNFYPYGGRFWIVAKGIPASDLVRCLRSWRYL